MSIIAKSLIHKSAPINFTRSKISLSAEAPNASTDEQFLKYYKQIAVLRAGVSLIADGVAQVNWRLYEEDKDGEREEVKSHEIKDLLHQPNPFWTGYDFFYLHQVYDELLGRNFWVQQYNEGSRELWLLPPQHVTLKTDPKKYIVGYIYKNGSDNTELPVDSVIYFQNVDPFDQLSGTGRVQAAGIDIENQSFMSQYNRNFFFRNCDPGTVISYPEDAQISPEEIDKLLEQLNQGHQGYGRAHKGMIVTGGATVTKEGSMSQRDMDYANLAKYNQSTILASLGLSPSMIGSSESALRANAEAQLFTFGRWVLTPRLIRIREKLNAELCPDFPIDETHKLVLDFDDPVPENRELSLNLATRAFQVSIIKRNEARGLLDFEPDPSPAGEEYIKVPGATPTGGDIATENPEKPSQTGNPDSQTVPKE